VKIVWTVHNLKPHDYQPNPLQRLAYAVLIRCIDAFISMSKYGEQRARQMYPALRRVRGFVIPHGHYRNLYADTVDLAEARQYLGLDVGADVYLFFGMIRPYKGIEALIEVFRETENRNAVLIIAGYTADSRYATRIADVSSADPRISCHIASSPIPADRVQYFMRAADLVVLPYRDILNSGSSLLALSFEVPIVVPRMGALFELEQLFGSAWVHTYETLSSADLTRWLAEAKALTSFDHKSLSAPFETLDWSQIARRTADAYRDILDLDKSGVNRANSEQAQR
jgi:glycosyltransferase involved in cell wall biosynthesis